MSKQTKQLKITATNIKSVLIERSKTIEKLKLRKAVLQRRQVLQAERKVAEKNIESKGKKGPMRSVLSGMGGMVMPIGMRIKNFFGALIMGWVVTKLPGIIKGLQNAWKIAKPLLSGAWTTLKIAFKAIHLLLWPILKVFGLLFGGKKNKVKKKVGGKEQEFTEAKVEGDEMVINQTEEETVDLEEPDSDTAEISSPETDAPDLEPKDTSDTGGSSSPVSSSPLSGVTPKSLVNGGKGGGSEQKKRKLPLQSANSAITKIRKVSQNLKGNGKKKNVNTVIVPIEVSASTNGNTGSSGQILQTPSPVMSGNSLENQRLP
tara:strand:+ start:387 stop:1340 length:954 start_codon:yes stop_codon:yes gene_type:complete